MVVLKLDTTILLTTTALMLLWNYGLVVCTNCDNLLDIFRNIDETFYIDLVKINSSCYRLFSSTFARSVYYFIKLVFYFKTNHAGQKKEQIQCIVENPIHTQSGDLKRHIKTIHEGGSYWKILSFENSSTQSGYLATHKRDSYVKSFTYCFRTSEHTHQDSWKGQSN